MEAKTPLQDSTVALVLLYWYVAICHEWGYGSDELQSKEGADICYWIKWSLCICSSKMLRELFSNILFDSTILPYILVAITITDHTL